MIKSLHLLAVFAPHLLSPSFDTGLLSLGNHRSLFDITSSSLESTSRFASLILTCLIGHKIFIHTTVVYFTCAGCISSTFTDAAEVSGCYRVNSENYCFYTDSSELSWDEARKFCERRNSTLPIITDEDADNVFQQFIVSDSYSLIQNQSVWIGAHAHPVSNSVGWHWIDGRPSGMDNTVVK